MLRAKDQIGPYTLISKVGRGAFAVVWLAERRTAITTTKVALKIPLDDDIDLNVIKQEADLWVQASGHPNVLPIIEANIYDEIVVIAGEYAPDGSLETWLKTHDPAVRSIEWAIDISLGILAGLEHLHHRRVIHRDLKPANVLLQGYTPRLADFGISRVLKTTCQTSIVAGTPAYMAPEAFDGKRSERTDIWSVGVIFYQLLAGWLPFAQEDAPSLMKAILTGNPDPLPPSIPESIRAVISCALSKDPSHRYQSAAEMHKALWDARRILAFNSDQTIVIGVVSRQNEGIHTQNSYKQLVANPLIETTSITQKHTEVTRPQVSPNLAPQAQTPAKVQSSVVEESESFWPQFLLIAFIIPLSLLLMLFMVAYVS